MPSEQKVVELSDYAQDRDCVTLVEGGIDAVYNVLIPFLIDEVVDYRDDDPMEDPLLASYAQAMKVMTLGYLFMRTNMTGQDDNEHPYTTGYRTIVALLDAGAESAYSECDPESDE